MSTACDREDCTLRCVADVLRLADARMYSDSNSSYDCKHARAIQRLVKTT